MGVREGNDKFYLECSCGCGILEFEKWNWSDGEPSDEIFLSYYIRVEEARWVNRISKKIKIIWAILTGKDAFLWGMSIPNDDVEKFKNFIASLK